MTELQGAASIGNMWLNMVDLKSYGLLKQCNVEKKTINYWKGSILATNNYRFRWRLSFTSFYLLIWISSIVSVFVDGALIVDGTVQAFINEAIDACKDQCRNTLMVK